MPGSDDATRELLGRRLIAALSTMNPDGTPHVVAVWFLYEDGQLFVACSGGSRKARNVAARPRASLMVDLRHPGRERGATALCEAELVTGEGAAQINRRIHERYLRSEAFADPRVGPVLEAFDDATLRLMPRRWIWWDMASVDREVFGGRLAGESYLLPLDD